MTTKEKSEKRISDSLAHLIRCIAKHGLDAPATKASFEAYEETIRNVYRAEFEERHLTFLAKVGVVAQAEAAKELALEPKPSLRTRLLRKRK